MRLRVVKFFFVLTLILAPMVGVGAANVVTVEDDTDIVLTNPAMTLILKSGSSYQSMVVNSGSIEFVVDGGGEVTLVSNDKYVLNSTDDRGGVKNTTCGTTSSTAVYSVEAGGNLSTVTFTPGTGVCDNVDSGSGSTGSGTWGGSNDPIVTSKPLEQNINLSVGGELVKLACSLKAGLNDPCRSVYYLASNNKRYVFPTTQIYYSWYKDYASVKTISVEEMYTYEIGGNVTMRPGTYMIKLTTDPKVYAVEPGGNLRWVESEVVAKKLFGDNWYKKIVDAPDGFFADYEIGNAVSKKITNKHPVGSLIKLGDYVDIYYVAGDNVKRKISSEAVQINNFRNEFVLSTNIEYGDGLSVNTQEQEMKIK